MKHLVALRDYIARKWISRNLSVAHIKISKTLYERNHHLHFWKKKKKKKIMELTLTI